MIISQMTVGNALLSTLSEADFALLQPHLTRIDLPCRFTFYAAGDEIEHIYFPEDGIVSIVASETNGHQVEVGIIGREGMAGTAAVLGADHSPHHVYVQVAGVSALRLGKTALREAMRASPSLAALLLRYIQTMLVQTASSVSAAAGYVIEQRLARWILMCDDRLKGEIHLTHEFIGMMLGTRRAGVTLAMQTLEVRLLIKASRGSISVRDRIGLVELAGGSYGFAESEYLRLMGISSYSGIGSTAGNFHYELPSRADP